MIRLGTTLRCNLPPRHIWVVLCDPARTLGRILMVNFTTLRETSVDDLCILDQSDYSLLTHKTTVAFSRHQSGEVTALEELIKRGEFSIIEPIGKTVLSKIVIAAMSSPQLPPAMKKLLAAEM